MSITDELRKWANGSTLSSWTLKKLIAIADRIDAEHQKAMSRAGQLLADAEKDRDYNYANWQECKQKVLQGNITIDELNTRIECLENALSHCIELPVDADGEYIRIWDVMDFTKNVRGLTVLGIGIVDASESSLGEFGLGVFVREGNDYVWYNAEFLHHHTPTVEDVLEDFYRTAKADSDANMGDLYETIAEYAAKLRLAGDEE